MTIETYLLFLVIFLFLINLILLFSISNFLIKLANSLVFFKKEIEDYYYIKKDKDKDNKQESGLVDL